MLISFAVWNQGEGISKRTLKIIFFFLQEFRSTTSKGAHMCTCTCTTLSKAINYSTRKLALLGYYDNPGVGLVICRKLYHVSQVKA